MVGTTGALRAMRPAGRAEVPAGLWCYRVDREWEQVGGVLGDGGNLVEWIRRLVGGGLTQEQVDSALLEAAPAGPRDHCASVLHGRTEHGVGSARAGHDQRPGTQLHRHGHPPGRHGGRGVPLCRHHACAEAGPAPELRHVICTGGALLGSPAWVQILADVLEMPLSLADEPEASSRGAAILGWEALGNYSREDAPDPPLRTFFPREKTAQAHRAAFQAQERLRHAVLGSREP